MVNRYLESKQKIIAKIPGSVSVIDLRININHYCKRNVSFKTYRC